MAMSKKPKLYHLKTGPGPTPPVINFYKMDAPRSHSRRARASMLQRTSMDHFGAQRGDRMERYRHRLPRFGKVVRISHKMNYATGGQSFEKAALQEP